MRLSLFFWGIGFCFVLLQATLLQIFSRGSAVPDLTLILCVYLALNRPTVAAVWTTFFLGYAVDVLSSPVLGVNAFALSCVFLVGSLSSRYIWARSNLISMVVVFAAVWLKVAALQLVWPLFEQLDDPWTMGLSAVSWEAGWSALASPALFVFLRYAQSRLEPVRNAATLRHVYSRI